MSHSKERMTPLRGHGEGGDADVSLQLDSPPDIRMDYQSQEQLQGE